MMSTGAVAPHGRRLEGRVAIVTGAGRGIGRGEAIALAAQGAAVVVNDLDTSVDALATADGRAADNVVATIRARGGQAVAHHGDVSDWADAEALIQSALDTFGRLDVLVNNAGVLRRGPVRELTETDLDLVLRVHVKGTVATMQFAARYWERRHGQDADSRGCIINTTSGSGLLMQPPNVALAAYAAAKGAIASLVMSTAYELAPFGVRVHGVAPRAATRMHAYARSEVFEGRAGAAAEREEPDYVGPVVAWLASDEAAYLNGQILSVGEGKIVHCKPWRAGATVSTDTEWDVDAIDGVFRPALGANGFDNPFPIPAAATSPESVG